MKRFRRIPYRTGRYNSMQIYRYIKYHIDRYNEPPTVWQIMDVVEYSSSSPVDRHLKKLEDFGLIRREPKGKPRNIILIDQNE